MRKTTNILIIILIIITLVLSFLLGYLFFGLDAQDNENIESNEVDHFDIELISDIYPAYPIGYELNVLLSDIDGIVISSSNENVAKIINNQVVTKGKGTTTITASINDDSKSIDITVTDLYTLPDEDSESKSILTTTICTTQEAQMLDEILERKINEAGYGTRAGVVAAARFLILEFPYRIAYFSESGRLDTTITDKVSDGEGRYYHKGLYLSEDKYDDIQASIYGPKYWGLYFKDDTTDDHSQDAEYLQGLLQTSDIGTDLYLMKRPNGLDCSGFVSWCYLNGGFDLGDMGAGGPDTYGTAQLGERVNITDELLQSDRIKCGDIAGFAGHDGIVIGVDENYIWIADNLITGTKVARYERNVESFNALGEDSFKYFNLMDDVYKEDGNYTNMW